MKKVRKPVYGKQVCAVLMACVFLVTVMSGCSGGGNGQSSDTPTDRSGAGTTQSGSSGSSGSSSGSSSGGSGSVDAPKARPVITMMNEVFGEIPLDDDTLMTALQDATGVDLDVTWVPNNVYMERLNVTTASGELPHILMFNGNGSPYQSNILASIQAGMFWELDAYLEQFPNLQTFHPIVDQNARVNGQLYFIPRPAAVSRMGTVIREDWLTKLGLEPPRSIDEFYNLAKAFAEQDPDGNGADDTYGLMLYEGFIPHPLFAAFQVPNNWKVDNNKFIKDAETPEYVEALKFVRKMYQEGLINREFAVAARNEARNDLYNHKVGMTIETTDALVPYYPQQMEKAGAGSVSWIAGPPLGPTYRSQGMMGGALIPKSSVKTEAELQTILSYFNTLRDPEVDKALNTIWEDMVTGPVENRVSIEGLEKNLVGDSMMFARPGTPNAAGINQRLQQYMDASIGDPSYGLISPTYLEKGNQLDTIYKDASIQFVLGEIDEAGFQAAIEQWRTTGGNQVRKELEEQFNN